MEICPDAPNALQLLRQYVDGDRSAIHLLAVAGTVVLALVWAFAITMAFVWG
jgi:hypothetical protein